MEVKGTIKNATKIRHWGVYTYYRINVTVGVVSFGRILIDQPIYDKFLEEIGVKKQMEEMEEKVKEAGTQIEKVREALKGLEKGTNTAQHRKVIAQKETEVRNMRKKINDLRKDIRTGKILNGKQVRFHIYH
jgi:peptidoglycan hydrolase CwlO-like protein